MENNKQLTITTGKSRKDLKWIRETLLWSEFCERLKIPRRSEETIDEYLAMPKRDQDDLKDVGGFVGGSFTGQRRKASAVESRDLITLDMDNIPAGGTTDILRRVEGLQCAAAVYSTRKHTEYAPRLRVIIPLDTPASADEYEPIARKVAELIGIEFCDPTTFEASRLMYWPSMSARAVYAFQTYDRPFCSKQAILTMYEDWRSVSNWPRVPGTDLDLKPKGVRQENPLDKKGIVGAFCRTYSITEAMQKFLPGVYEETDIPGRFTFTGGSTAGGAVLYDNDTFLFSHHATDPCSSQLVNAWDMVRLHKYTDLDDEAPPDPFTNRLPSFKAMEELVRQDEDVMRLMAKERHEKAQQTFANSLPEGGVKDSDWQGLLTYNKKGFVEPTISNIHIILQNDENLKGRIATDIFMNRGLITCPVPWDLSVGSRQWMDFDDSGVFEYLEHFYGINTKQKVYDALLIVGRENSFNAVEQYLKRLKWDGKKRLDTLLIDYLGAEDSVYTREVIRKSLTAAVARAIKGQVKYDTMPVLVGPQGIGKSTFLRNLGKEWFSDSLTTFEGKDAAELIQGTWINEISELTAMRRQDANNVKQFLSKEVDRYRAAYGKHVFDYPRRCVFFGTSNDVEFLYESQNRRFWPVDVDGSRAEKSVWRDMPKEVDQIWAEAYMRFILGETLTLSKEAEDFAEIKRTAHREENSMEGEIRAFLDTEVPVEWDDMDLQTRKMFLNGQKIEGVDLDELVPLKRTCALEVWRLLFARAYNENPRRSDSKVINDIVRKTSGWEETRMYFKKIGLQRGFKRIQSP